MGTSMTTRVALSAVAIAVLAVPACRFNATITTFG